MSYLNWDASMELGHSQVDAEHRALLVHLNRLVDVVFGVNQENEAFRHCGGRQACVEAAVEALRLATVEHFRSEESLMAAAAFPGLGAHADQHEELLDQLAKFAEHLHANQAESLPHAVRFFREWFEFHIDTFDRAVVRWINTGEEIADESVGN